MDRFPPVGMWFMDHDDNNDDDRLMRELQMMHALMLVGDDAAAIPRPLDYYNHVQEPSVVQTQVRSVTPLPLLYEHNNDSTDCDDTRRFLKFGDFTLFAVDATFLVTKLVQLNNNNNNNNMTNVLSLSRMRLSRQAQNIICNGISHLRLFNLDSRLTESLLQDISNNNNSAVVDLQVDFPAENDAQRQRARDVIDQLMHNRGINATNNNNTLTGLVVGNAFCPLPVLSPFVQACRQTLCRLGFQTCRLGDEGVEALVNAFVAANNQGNDNNNNAAATATTAVSTALRDLDLSTNRITFRGLVMLSRLNVTILPNLKRLILNYNAHLLDDGPSTRIFCQRMLQSTRTARNSTNNNNGTAAAAAAAGTAVTTRLPSLQVLHVRGCSDVHDGYSVLVKSLADDSNSLTQLDMTLSEFEHLSRPLRYQFTCSLPKMKRLQKLSCEGRLLNVGRHARGHGDDDDAQRSLMLAAALFQNTSLLQVTTIDEADTRCVAPVLQRNLNLLHIRSLLVAQQQQPPLGASTTTTATIAATTTTTTTVTTSTTTTTVPVALWSHVFCQVGGKLRQQQQGSNNRSSSNSTSLLHDDARADASPIFVVLRDRPNAFTEYMMT